MTNSPKAEVPITPNHLDWLVENRYSNQRHSAELYRLLVFYPEEIRTKSLSADAQILVGVAFSLWRSVFLSDKTGPRKDSLKDASNFLKEVLLTNSISFTSDRNARNWTFNYYARNAQYGLGAYEDKHLDSAVSVSRYKQSPKQRWKHLQEEFGNAVSHFRKNLKAAKKKKSR